jgi:hypothetical protein
VPANGLPHQNLHPSRRRSTFDAPSARKASSYIAVARMSAITIRPLDSVSVSKGDPDRLARFTIHADAGDKQVAFYPRGKTVPAWQYRLASSRYCERAP